MKRFNRSFLLLVFLAGLFFLQSCSEDDPQPVLPQIVLDDLDRRFTRPEGEVKGILQSFVSQDLVNKVEYDVTFYEITYKTTYLGQEIIASGLVTFPETMEAVPMIAFHNGTNTQQTEAPSASSTFKALSGLAGTGYIVCIPDYLGFGASSSVFHPYYHYQSTVDASLDMIRATRELASIEGYNFNGKLFLSGYSQGGYAAMAAHKAIEESPLEGIQLVASAPSSGGYDIKGVQEYFFDQTEYDQPYYLAYVARSYQTVYDWSQPLSDLFQEPYATRIPDLFDGVKSASQINAQLTNVIADLVHPDFLTNIDTDPKYDYVVDAFEGNSVNNWVPTVRMLLYHGDADVTIPYQNSVDTYNNMLSLGASESILTFTNLSGKNHGTGFVPYIESIFEEFDELK